MSVFENKTYELQQEWKEFFDGREDLQGNTYPGYHYARPVDYAIGTYIGDCWIVNKDGNTHPLIDNHPYAIPFSAVKPTQHKG